MKENKPSRVLVNFIGVPSILLIIYLGDTFLNIPLFSIFVAIVLFLGAKEISIFAKDKDARPIIELLFVFIAIIQLDRHPLINWDIPLEITISSLFLITMILEIFRNEKKPLLNISIIFFSFIWLGIMLGSLSELRNLPEYGFRITIALFLSVWICDTAGFLFGKKFGIKKIIPLVSPNKTWVGTVAGFISSILFLLILYFSNFFSSMLYLMDILFIGIFTGGFGQLGDWGESLLKRESKIKDTSNFLKGHGGVLDRFDSLAYAAPLTLIYCKYFIEIG